MSSGDNLTVTLRYHITKAAQSRWGQSPRTEEIEACTTKLQQIDAEIARLKNLTPSELEAEYEQWYTAQVEWAEKHNERNRQAYSQLVAQLRTIKKLIRDLDADSPLRAVLESALQSMTYKMWRLTPQPAPEMEDLDAKRQRDIHLLRSDRRACATNLARYQKEQARHEQYSEKMAELDRYLNGLPADLLS